MRVKVMHLLSCLEQVREVIAEDDKPTALALRDGYTQEHIDAIDKTVEVLKNTRVFDPDDVILAFE